jgi:hypothetical protein
MGYQVGKSNRVKHFHSTPWHRRAEALRSQSDNKIIEKEENETPMPISSVYINIKLGKCKFESRIAQYLSHCGGLESLLTWQKSQLGRKKVVDIVSNFKGSSLENLNQTL